MILYVTNEDARLFFTAVAGGLARVVATKRAMRWVTQNYIAHSHPNWRTLGGLKAQFERENLGEYLLLSNMREAFEANGITVRGEKVYARQLRCSVSAAKPSVRAIYLKDNAKTVVRSRLSPAEYTRLRQNDPRRLR